MRFHPGYYVKAELKCRRVPKKGIPAFLGLSAEEAESLLDCRLTVTEDVAEKIAAAFGTSREMWLNLQKRYDSGEIEEN